MNINPQSTYNFTEKRLKRESPREFVSNFMNEQFTPLIIKLSEDLNMTTEDATAYALAFFNSVQDIFWFHHNLDLGPFKIYSIRNKPLDYTPIPMQKKIYKLRELMREPYFTNRTEAVSRGKRQLEAILKDLSRHDRKVGAPKDQEKYDAKMAVIAEKRRKATIKRKNQKYYKARAKVLKAIKKQWAWTKDP